MWKNSRIFIVIKAEKLSIIGELYKKDLKYFNYEF